MINRDVKHESDHYHAILNNIRNYNTLYKNKINITQMSVEVYWVDHSRPSGFVSRKKYDSQYRTCLAAEDKAECFLSWFVFFCCRVYNWLFAFVRHYLPSSDWSRWQRWSLLKLTAVLQKRRRWRRQQEGRIAVQRKKAAAAATWLACAFCPVPLQFALLS